jgi:catechol 2,3-dioxygenase-like lactoylglutathione lyase family enzyme
LSEYIASISRVVTDLTLSKMFYIEALGFSLLEQGPCDAELLQAIGSKDTAERAALRLGDEIVILVQFASPAPLKIQTDSNDLWFQHIAVVVGDIDLAYRHLSHFPDWQFITEGGPQQLPTSDGGVRAFKFRGPDGHPFELIWFPPGQGRSVWHVQPQGALFLGIDHTALSISSTRSSIAFYQSLGFGVKAQSLNVGIEQSLLDAIPGALVDVTSMRLPSTRGMGIELLRYHPHGRELMETCPDNLVTDWITLSNLTRHGSSLPRMIKDPDEHRVIVDVDV